MGNSTNGGSPLRAGRQVLGGMGRGADGASVVITTTHAIRLSYGGIFLNHIVLLTGRVLRRLRQCRPILGSFTNSRSAFTWCQFRVRGNLTDGATMVLTATDAIGLSIADRISRCTRDATRSGKALPSSERYQCDEDERD
jgi:hypothetical protein